MPDARSSNRKFLLNKISSVNAFGRITLPKALGNDLNASIEYITPLIDSSENTLKREYKDIFNV